MEKRIISQENLARAVEAYEGKVLKSTVRGKVNETPLIIRYKGTRRDKLVVLNADGAFETVIREIMNVALEQLETDQNMSENVEVFSLSAVTDTQRTQYSSQFLCAGLSVTITDRMQMENIEEFKPLFADTDEDVDYDTLLYDYLSIGNDTTDVKISLYYALLLMMLYQNQPVSKAELERLMRDKYGNNAGDVGIALKELRKEGKIAHPGINESINLTAEEQARLENSLKEERTAANDFMSRYQTILEKYEVEDGDSILEALREAYAAQYHWQSKGDDNEGKKEEEGRKQFEKIRAVVLQRLGDQTNAFISEIRELCDQSDYLSRYSLSHSFLQLFRDPGYEKYISHRENDIILDTPVVTCYLCYLSGLEDEYDFEWDNAEYQSLKSLAGIQEKSKGKTHFAIPFDYLQETVGELKKALQFSWFDNLDLAVGFSTGNTIYNFYLAVKEAKKAAGEDVRHFNFSEFVKGLGFEELNPNSSMFSKKTLARLRFFFEKLGCETIDPITEHYDKFDEVRSRYEYHLYERDRKKTQIAVNSDIRQAFFLAKETIDDEYDDVDCFLASWDKTLRPLRDIVNEELALETSYKVMNPTNLANKLAFRNFQINNKSVSDDVFAYADSGFNIVSKVQSLYDNILTPYFANANNKNSALVVTMLKMEKNSQDAEGNDTSRSKENTTLADIFLPIVYALPDYDISPQNLRDFLADDKNNDFVLELFQEAFDAYAKGEEIDISERLCLRLKENLIKGETDIKL